MHKNKTNSERKMPKNPQVSKRLSKFGMKSPLNNTHLMNLCAGNNLSTRGTRDKMIERLVTYYEKKYSNDDNNDESTDGSGTSSSDHSSDTSDSDDDTGTSSSEYDTSSEEDEDENEESLENILNVLSEDDADDNVSTKKSPVDVRFTFFLNGKNITKIDSQGPRAKLTILTLYGIERTIESTVLAAEDFGSLIDMSDNNYKYDVLWRKDKLRWYVSNPFNTKAKLELSDYNDNGVEDEIERLVNKGQGFVLDIIIPLKKISIVEIDNHQIEELSNPSNNRKKSNNNTSTTTTTTTTKSTDDEKRLVKIHLLSGGAVEHQNNNQVYATNSTAERSFTFDIENATLKKIKGVLLFGKDTKLFCQALHVKPKPHAKKVETIDNDEHLKSILEEASAKNKQLYFVFNLLSESSLNKKTVDVEYLANVDYENLVIEKVKKHSSFNESNELNELIQVIDKGIEKLYHDANSCIHHGYSQRTRMTYMRELRQFKKTELLHLVTAVKDLNFSFGGFKSNITICKNQFKPDKHGGIPVQLSSASGSSSGASSNFKEEYFKEALEEKQRIRKRELEIREEELALKKRKLDQENGNYATTGNNNTGTTSPFEKKLKAIERVCALNCHDEYKRKLLDQIEANPQYQDSNATEEE